MRFGNHCHLPRQGFGDMFRVSELMDAEIEFFQKLYELAKIEIEHQISNFKLYRWYWPKVGWAACKPLPLMAFGPLNWYGQIVWLLHWLAEDFWNLKPLIFVGYPATSRPTCTWSCWHGGNIHCLWNRNSHDHDVESSREGMLPRKPVRWTWRGSPTIFVSRDLGQFAARFQEQPSGCVSHFIPNNILYVSPCLYRLLNNIWQSHDNKTCGCSKAQQKSMTFWSDFSRSLWWGGLLLHASSGIWVPWQRVW